MKPSNQAERAKAFTSFLIFFIVTVGVILTSVFFSFKVPLRENDQFRAEAKRIENERVILSSFQAKMEETANLLDSINESGNQIPIVDNQIDRNIAEMTAMITDSITDRRFYQGLIGNLGSMKKAKKQLRDAYGKDNETAELKERINELQTKLDNCNNNLSQINSSLQRK